MWYKFSANNQDARYGYSEDADVAQAAVDHLNQGREIDLWTLDCLGDDEYEADGSDIRLADRSDLIITFDSTVSDFRD